MKLPPFGLGHSLYRGNLGIPHSDGVLRRKPWSRHMLILAMISPVCPTICGSTINLPQQAFMMAAPWSKRLHNSAVSGTIAMAKHMIKMAYGILWPMACRLIFVLVQKKPPRTWLLVRKPRAPCIAGASGMVHDDNDEATQVAAADAVEIYSYSCVVSSARGSSISIADFLLNEGHKISFTATDDSHFDLPDFAGGWVMVAAPKLSQDSIVPHSKQDTTIPQLAPILLIFRRGWHFDCLPTPVHSCPQRRRPFGVVCNGNITVARFDLSNLT